MKHSSFKYTLLLVSVSIFICLPSCYDPEPPDHPRPVTCEMPEGYNYEDYYERWRQPICTTSMCSTYTSIWRDLLIERTTLTEPYFNAHFEILESSVSSSVGGDFFVIGYRMQKDWAVGYNADKFIIRIHEGTNSFPEIGLPVDTYLTKKEIAAALDNRGFESRIDEIPKTGPLKFSSPEEALKTLITEANVDTLCFYRVVLSHDIGTLTLKSFARYIDNEDECIEASIDLITGQILIKRTHPCSNGYDRY